MKRSTVPPPPQHRWYDILIDAELLFGGFAAIALVRWLSF